MFKLYLSKVLAILRRPLANSEINIARSFFESGKSANYTAEYLK